VDDGAPNEDAVVILHDGKVCGFEFGILHSAGTD
jgi:hypothetical protein